MAEALEGFTQTTFEHGGKTRSVFRAGSGPGVVVIHEAPGITPLVAAFGRRVVDAGFTVAMPSLFGEPGRPGNLASYARSFPAACVSREFAALARGRTAPVTDWLRALARSLHEGRGGSGIGVVGMCFTGGFGLGMMLDPSVTAPVLSQPSLPLGLTRSHRRDLHLAPADVETVRRRAVEEGCAVLGLRFTHDKLSPPERFARLRELLGDAFIAVEIDSSPGNPHGIPRNAHSVLTEHFVDEPGHPTSAALDRVLAHLVDRLQA